MGLLQENAVAQGVRDHYQFSGLPFIIPPLLSLDAFFAAMVEEFGDKLAHETALKNLQNCKMGNMKIGDFNYHFKSLSGLVLDAPESICMDYYKRALSGPIRCQAILRADWASAQTLTAKMSIATLASQQLDEANGVTHSKHLPPHSTNHMISVPQDKDSMEIDVINLSASNPSNFPKKHYVDECKRQKACTRCLSPYNDTHRTASGSATCPNAAASLASKIQGRLAFQDPYLHLRQDHRNLSNEPSPLSPHHLPLTHPTFGLTHRALILMGTLATCHLTLHHRSRRPLHHPHLGPRKRQTYRLSFRSTPTCISQCIMICQALISQRIRHQSHHPPLHHPLLPLV